jgi:Putative transposase
VECGGEIAGGENSLIKTSIDRQRGGDRAFTINAKGQVEIKLKTPWRDGTTHHVMSPLEFMQRLAALVPQP